MGGLELASIDIFSLLSKNYQCYFLSRIDSPIEKKVSALNPKRSLKTARHQKKYSRDLIQELRALIREKKISLIHVHNAKDVWLARFASRGLDVRLVYTCHFDIREKKHSKNDFIHRWIYKEYDAFTVQSNYQREGFLFTHPVAEEKVHVIPNFVNLSKIQSNSKSLTEDFLKWRAGSIVMCALGRIDPGKGQRFLLNFMRKKMAKFPQLKLLLVGGNPVGIPSDLEVYLKKIVAAEHLQDRIYFAGHQSDPIPWLKESDFFVLASRRESFGIVLLEAMACSKAVLATNRGGPVEIVEDGRCGSLFEYNDFQGLEVKIEELLQDDRLKLWGKAAQERVRERFDENAVKDSWSSLIDKTLA